MCYYWVSYRHWISNPKWTATGVMVTIYSSRLLSLEVIIFCHNTRGIISTVGVYLWGRKVIVIWAWSRSLVSFGLWGHKSTNKEPAKHAYKNASWYGVWYHLRACIDNSLLMWWHPGQQINNKPCANNTTARQWNEAVAAVAVVEEDPEQSPLQSWPVA